MPRKKAKDKAPPTPPHADARGSRLQGELHQLLRMVCHDIGNPLSLVKSVLHSRLRVAKGEEAEAWKVISRATQSIESILANVKRYEAYSSGRDTFELKSCSLKMCFEEIEFVFGSRIRDKGQSLSWTLGKGVDDLWVIADQSALLNEVMSNLVSNAIKFTDVGGEVRISAAVADDMVRICVRDNGIGMPKALLDQIFDTEPRPSRDGTSGETGTGFGMPLIRNFTEMFGGSVEIQSQEKKPGEIGHGTTVTLILRLASPAQEKNRAS